MGRPRLNDKAWQYCTAIACNRNHVSCNFCGHTMWGGVSRFKEHLAQKRGDVAVCKMCPLEVTTEMQTLLIELSLAKEKRQKRKREMLEHMRRETVASQTQEGESERDVDAEERALIDRAIKESLVTHAIEEREAKLEDEQFESACRESVCSYELQLKRRGEGSSNSQAGPSGFCNWTLDDEMDYDSDLDF